MDEQLKEVLVPALQKAVQAAEKTGQWALDIAPELIQQFLQWHFWTYMVGFIVGVMLVCCSIYTIRLGLKNNWYPSEKGKQTSIILSTMLNITLGPFVMFYNLYFMIFITVAPKIYLIETLLK